MNKAQIARKERLLPNGKPRYVRCYDNNGETADRYTVVFTGNYNNIGKPKRTRKRSTFVYLGMSENPFHPQGVGTHGDSDTPIDRPAYSHLGKKVAFESLSAEAQKCAIQTYLDIWKLE